VILADTSVWIEHLRRGVPALAAALEDDRVLVHPFVIGELTCGRLTRRDEILGLLAVLPHAPTIDHHEALAFVEQHDLAGAGVGWIDVHLLAAASLARAPLWTLDRRLRSVAGRLDLEP